MRLRSNRPVRVRNRVGRPLGASCRGAYNRIPEQLTYTRGKNDEHFIAGLSGRTVGLARGPVGTSAESTVAMGAGCGPAFLPVTKTR
jgi:hypothetical protein